MSRNIAIIPARGGSKRLPRKNILPFKGIPIIVHTLKAAQAAGLFEKIVVSTEDAEIKRLVSGMKCVVHDRSQDLATDTARVVDVVKNVLNDFSKKGETFDRFCCLYPTAPLRGASDIQNAYDLMIAKKADYCLGVSEYAYSPFFAFDIDESEGIKRRWPELAKLPPWKKPTVVADNGSIYWAKVEAFLKSGELEGERSVGYLMPRALSVDIDTIEDLELAEFYANSVETKKKS